MRRSLKFVERRRAGKRRCALNRVIDIQHITVQNTVARNRLVVNSRRFKRKTIATDGGGQTQTTNIVEIGQNDFVACLRGSRDRNLVRSRAAIIRYRTVRADKFVAVGNGLFLASRKNRSG